MEKLLESSSIIGSLEALLLQDTNACSKNSVMCDVIFHGLWGELFRLYLLLSSDCVSVHDELIIHVN